MAHLAPVSRRPIDPELAARVAERFGVDPAGLDFVRDVANVVYASADGSRFLRFTHRADRSALHVRAEIEWLRFLVGEGLPVCRPIPSVEGEPTVPADAYTVVAFERVPGRAIAEDEYGEEVLERVGSFLARLHTTSDRFTPRDPGCVRPHWHELDPFEATLASWEPDDRLVVDAWRRVFPRIAAWEALDDRYGLVHADVHRGNVFLCEGRVHVFDFDDCCRFFLAADVANTLFYTLWHHRNDPEDERRRRGRSALDALLRGYRAERPFGEREVARIPDLLEFRELTVDAFSHRRRPRPDAEVRERYRLVRERLARGAPYVSL